MKKNIPASKSAKSAKSTRKTVDIADFATLNNINNNASSLRDTPFIPLEVYELLPTLLKESCSQIEGRRKKDVFLTSTFGVISACLPNVFGFYGGEKYYPNLNTMTIAPALQRCSPPKGYHL